MVDASGDESIAARVLRPLLLAVLVLGVVGTLAELLLLEHYEDREQLVPLALLTAAVVAVLIRLARPGRASMRVFQAVMIGLVISGGLGVYFHYSGNREFELEMYPSRAGLELFWESLKGATPVLAPGSMAQLGLLGLAYSFRHPLLRKRPQ